jgi:di/tricarboxylate transporter
MTNTPVVAVMILVVILRAIKLGTAPPKVVIPFSYMTAMGGMIAMIGTSANLLVDGVAVEQGLAQFSLSEIAPLGIAVTLAAGVFLRIETTEPMGCMPARTCIWWTS